MIKLTTYPYGWICSSCGTQYSSVIEVVACLEEEGIAQHIALCARCLEHLRTKLNIRRGKENATEQ